METKTFLLLLVVTRMTIGAFALPVVRPTLPEVSYLDTEVVTNVPFTAWEANIRFFEVSMSFHASASNNVELAFGIDTNTDGILTDGEETSLVVGWDCGEWFIRNHSTGERLTSEPTGTNVIHNLDLLLEMRSSGQIKAVTLTDNSSTIFPSMSSEKPSWLYSAGWDTIRLIGRGENVREGENFHVKTTPAGFSIILRDIRSCQILSSRSGPWKIHRSVG